MSNTWCQPKLQIPQHVFHRSFLLEIYTKTIAPDHLRFVDVSNSVLKICTRLDILDVLKVVQ